MTQEEKAKRYNEVLEQAKNWYVDAQIDFKKSLEALLPELKESEDEKIRKALINVFATHKDYEMFFGVSVADILAWLEKQGSQKLANSAKTCKDEQNPTDKEIKEALRTEYEKGRADAIAEIQNPVDCIDCTNSKGCINCKNGNMKETLVQKTAWSEEDEERLQSCLNILQAKGVMGITETINTKWLKSLKERIGG